MLKVILREEYPVSNMVEVVLYKIKGTLAEEERRISVGAQILKLRDPDVWVPGGYVSKMLGMDEGEMKSAAFRFIRDEEGIKFHIDDVFNVWRAFLRSATEEEKEEAYKRVGITEKARRSLRRQLGIKQTPL